MGLILRELRDPLLLAFSTTSSRIGAAQSDCDDGTTGVPSHIVGFVLPAGYSFNLDGSTLYLALASLFYRASDGKVSVAGDAD